MSETTTVPVDFTLDLTCVHSYLGFTRFERAAARLRERGVAVSVRFHPFQVSSDAPEEGEPLSAVHERFFGSRWKVAEATGSMAEVGARDGLEFNFDRAVHANTFRAHRLVAAASAQGAGEAAVERLFRAYLTDGINIGDPGALARIAAEVGVTPPEGGDDELRAALERVRAEGVHAVPRVRVAGGRPMVGAQTEQTYTEALEQQVAASR
ncbi:DsbA family oxidoreductase [Actinosynnema sp. NPDC023587]|uniref:DsbA family oxidoreductase n=1 Tax=Actinosynnema sp. NPDC023587 TaxID=3154695 RepID=UPI0034005285